MDNVSEEAEIAGRSAAEYALGRANGNAQYVNVTATDGVRYALPQKISEGEGKIKVFFRVGDVYRNCKLIVESGGEKILSKKFMVLAPGEMGSIDIDRSRISGDVVVRLEQ